MCSSLLAANLLFDASVQLALAIMLPVVFLLIGIGLGCLVCRCRHRRRMDEINARERFLGYANGDILAEHVGDNTLQVYTSILLQQSPSLESSTQQSSQIS